MGHKNTTSLHTLQDLVDGFQQKGPKTALIRLRKTGLESYTYGHIFQKVQRLAWGLMEKGVKPGQMVGLLGPLDAAWLTTCLGVLQAGAVVMPLDLQLDRKTLGRILKDSQPYCMFTRFAHESQLRQLLPKGCALYLLDKAPQEPNSWERLLTENQHPLPEIGIDQPAALFYTSGTTGPPKGVPLTHRNLVFQIHTVQETHFLMSGDRVLLPLPVHHVYPFVIGMLSPLSLGATMVLPHSLTGPQMVRSLREGDVTLLLGVPRLYQALFGNIARKFESHTVTRGLFESLLAANERLNQKTGWSFTQWLFSPVRRRFAPSLRILASGGAAMSSRLAHRLEDLGWQVAIGYGLTETAPLLTLKLPGDPHLDSVGRPVKGVDLRIDASESADFGDQRSDGEIQVRGPNVFSGYHHLPDKTDEVFTPDGWFRTGDLGYLDPDGYLHLTGRVSTLMVTPGGENVQPHAIETRLAGHRLIREAGVFQQQDGTLSAVIVPELSEARFRHIETLQPAVQEAMTQQTRQLPSYQHVHDFALTQRPLPRTRLGKIRRHLLEDIFQQARSQQGASSKSDQTGPVPLDDMSVQDRSLLETPEAHKVWDWLIHRYREHRLSPDTRLELDLGVDSMEWLNMTLEIGQRTGIELDEEDISEVVIVRDLLQTVIRKAAGGETHPSVSPLESPEQVLTAEQMRWVQPTGTVQDGLATFLYSLLRKTAVHMFEFSSRGTENIPTEGPFIITPNHVSYLDAFAVAAALDLERLHRIYWAGFTGAAFKNVFFRYFSRLSRTIPIDPEHGILSGMALAATVLSRRQGLVWFPEGERSPDGRLQPFKSGIGLLLTHYPVPVIPAFVHGTERILPRGRAIPRPGTIHLTFGPRLDPDTLADKGEGEKRMDRITSGLHQEVAHLGKIVAPNPGPEK